MIENRIKKLYKNASQKYKENLSYFYQHKITRKIKITYYKNETKFEYISEEAFCLRNILQQKTLAKRINKY